MRSRARACAPHRPVPRLRAAPLSSDYTILLHPTPSVSAGRRCVAVLGRAAAVPRNAACATPRPLAWPVGSPEAAVLQSGQ